MPEEWKKAAIVPLFKGKESKTECNNYRGTRMLSVAGKSLQQNPVRKSGGDNRRKG